MWVKEAAAAEKRRKSMSGRRYSLSAAQAQGLISSPSEVRFRKKPKEKKKILDPKFVPFERVRVLMNGTSPSVHTQTHTYTQTDRSSMEEDAAYFKLIGFVVSWAVHSRALHTGSHCTQRIIDTQASLGDQASLALFSPVRHMLN